jgi:hypothetical protein
MEQSAITTTMILFTYNVFNLSAFLDDKMISYGV